MRAKPSTMTIFASGCSKADRRSTSDSGRATKAHGLISGAGPERI